jgi:hypothetical protein
MCSYEEEVFLKALTKTYKKKLFFILFNHLLIAAKQLALKQVASLQR